MQKKLVLLCLTLSLLVTACGTSPENQPTQNPVDQDPAAFREYKEQEVKWGPCDPGLFATEDRQILGPLGERLECATIKAPLDWEDPELDKVAVGILRVKASDAANRKGAIFINPGGPGGDGLDVAAFLGFRFSFPEPGSPAADILQQVSSHYDILGFSPRGLGGSVQLYCGGNIRPPKTNFYTDRSPENAQALLTQNRLETEACERNPVSKYIDTEQTVKDMDLIRHLLGDKKLNFLGYSYGSWLGAWYAKQFPEKTGHMVLDSNTDFSTSFERTVLLTPAAREDAFRKVAIPYFVRNNAVFELGTTEEEANAVYDTLPIDIKAVIAGPIVGLLYSATATPDIGVILVAAKGVSAVLQANPELGPNAFLEALAAYRYATLEEVNTGARTVALQIGEAILSNLTAQPEPIALSPGNAVFRTVLCNDNAWNKDPNFWVEAGNKANIETPLNGGVLTLLNCTYWKNQTAEIPEVPEGMPPIMLLQAEFDPATNTEGALSAFESLPNAKMVFINDEKIHAVFPHGSECVDVPIAQHLLDGSLPNERVTKCAALPLPGETTVFPADGFTPQSLQGLSALPAEPEKTLDDRIHERIRENARNLLGGN
jgi:pimeloyl-ACP methyl ester carboxylesterase